MRKILTILVVIVIGCGIGCYAQGKVTRQKKEKTETQKTTSKKTANKKKAQENKKDDSKNIKKEEPVTGTTPAPSNYINGHEYVDLGLPSGTKWATCNVGASSPEEYGDYFAQCETKPKSSYTRENSLTFFKNFHDLQKKGIINPAGILAKMYDAASVNWGGTWRMPTKAECDEILENCTWKMVSRGGKRGYMVIGPNRRSIFLPFAGEMYESGVSRDRIEGRYGTSSAYNNGGDFAEFYIIAITNSDRAVNDNVVVRSRSVLGYSVRPVSN